MIFLAALLMVGVGVLLFTRDSNAAIERRSLDIGETSVIPSSAGDPAPAFEPPSGLRAPVIEEPRAMRPTPDLPTQVPTLRMRKNPGQNPKTPPIGIYSRFKTQIDRFTVDLNEASAGANVGLNSWWRSPSDKGEALSQHLIACAADFQGPDQESVAAALEAKGWSIVRMDNQGKPYRHIHAQLEPAGFLSRLGVTRESLAV